MDIRQVLFSLAEEAYRDFSAALMPTVDRKRVIGVRVPHLRKLAKSLSERDARAFLSALPHTYHEEDLLHCFLIGKIKEERQCIAAITAFLPYIDNWAVCDSLRPRCLANDPALLLQSIEIWLKSPHPYTVRFGMEMLMVHFLGARFRERYLAMVANTRSDEYYVDMMAAWFFATALTRQYEKTLPYFEDRRLSPSVHNKAIQKAVDSLQIPKERKEYLKSLRCGQKEKI